MSEPAPQTNWTIEVSGAEYGPYTRSEMRRLQTEGRIDGDILGYDNIVGEWRRLADIESLRALFAVLPPPLADRTRAVGPPSEIVHTHTTPSGEPIVSGQYAGFWIRFAAHMIDGVALFAISVIGLLVLSGFDLNALEPGEDSNKLYGIVNAAIGIAYFVVLHGGPWQATLGKRAVGIHLMRRDGSRVGYGLAFGRYFAWVLACLPFAIGLMMVGWTSQKRGLHDMICGTRVIYGEP